MSGSAMHGAEHDAGTSATASDRPKGPSALTGRIYEPFRASAASLKAKWRRLNLAQQFALAAAVVLAIGMVTIGLWVAERIKHGVVHNSAASAALYMDSFIAPIVQGLAHQDTLSQDAKDRLEEVLKHTAIGTRVVWIKIWRLDGLIVYANRKELIGQHFAPSANFLKAASGTVAAEFEGPHHRDAHHHEEPSGPDETAMLEIYAPVREANTDRIIAVSEFYQKADRLKAELRTATALSWIVVGGVTAMMMAALSGIVHRGSRTIDEQQERLQAHIRRLQTLLAQNEELSQRVQRAYKRTADINERFLRRISADLHDGPAQLLSLALLRLDSIAPATDKGAPEQSAAYQALERIRAVLTEAFQEIRHISSGLALPELESSTVDEVLRIAARAHEARTQTTVHCEISAVPAQVPGQIKVCLYRLVQEGLTNAFRHAKGRGQRLTATTEDGVLKVEVADSGAGMSTEVVAGNKGGGLGLSGLRDRIETLGGTLEIRSSPQTGTRLTAKFSIAKIQQMEQLDA